ncbi:MAG: hypothetical protein QM831_38145 [Kofleriaceae bacterium]
MKAFILIAFAGCLDQQPTTDTDVAALGGETWTTVDDNDGTVGAGAFDYSIAVNPNTSKIMMTGYRREADGTSTAIIRGQKPGAGWGLNSTYKTNLESSTGRKIVVDHNNNWYVWISGSGANGATHDILRWSNNDGASWTTRFDDVPMVGPGTKVSDIFVDGGGRLFVLRETRGTIEMSTDHGVTFSSSSAGGTPEHLCEVVYGGTTTIYSLGSGSVASTDLGTTWHAVPLPSGPCSQAQAGTIAIGQFHGGGTYNGVTGALVQPMSLPDESVPVFDGVNQKAYFVGHENGYWWVEREDGAIKDVYTLDLNAAQDARAFGGTYDSEMGLYVVGTSMDDAISNPPIHGIVRHRQ